MKKKLVIASCILLFCIISVLIVAVILINNSSFQQKLLRKLSQKIGYQIEVKSIGISIRHGICINAKELHIKDKEKSLLFFCPDLFLRFQFANLLRRRFFPDVFLLKNPKVIIDIEKIRSRKKGSSVNLFPFLSSITSVSIKDALLCLRPYPIKIEKIEVLLNKRSEDVFCLNLDSNAIVKKARFPFHIKGLFKLKEGKRLKADIQSEFKELPLDLFKKDYLSFLGGSLFGKLHLLYDEKITCFGKLKFKRPKFVLIGINRQKKLYSFPWLISSFKADLLSKKILFSPLSISSEDFSLKVSSVLKIGDLPFISLKVNSRQMDIVAFKKIFPTCLLPEWLESRLFPIIKEGRLQDIRFSLEGTLNQIKNLTHVSNKKVLFGSLIMDKLLIFPKNAKAPLKDITGKVVLKDGDFSVTDINAKLSSSYIKNSKFIIKDIYHANRHYYIYANGRFYFKDLMGQLDMEFTPSIIKERLKDVENISGRLNVKLVCQYKKPWKYPRFNNSSVLIENTFISYRSIPLGLIIRKGNFWIDSTGKYHFIGNGLFGRSKLNIVLSAEKDFEPIILNISGSLSTDQLSDVFFKKRLILKNPVNIKACIKRKGDILNIKGRIYSKKDLLIKAGNFNLIPKHFSTNFFITYKPNRVFIKKFSFRSLNSSFYISGIINKRLLSLRFKSPKTSLEDLGIKVKGYGISGKIKTDIKIKYPISKPISNLLLYGYIITKDMSLYEKDIIAKKCDMKLIFNGKRLNISSFDSILLQYPVHITGVLKDWSKPKGRLNVGIKFLDLKNVLAHRSKSGSSLSYKDIDLDISLNISKAKCKEIIFSPIKSRIFVKKEGILIDNLYASTGYGDIMFNKKDKLSYIKAKIKGFPIEKLFSCLEVKKYIDGKMDIDVELISNSKNIKKLIPNLDGRLDLLINDGKIYKAQPVLKILDFFSLSNIWKLNPSSLFKEGVPFDSIKIEAKVKKGVIIYNKMKLKSTAINAAGKGTLDLNRKWIDLGIAIQPLSTVDSIIGRLPLVGYIIGGKEKKITLYYFEVKGPLNNVKIKQVPIENLVKGTLNIFKRILLTPAHMLENIQ